MSSVDIPPPPEDENKVKTASTDKGDELEVAVAERMRKIEATADRQTGTPPTPADSEHAVKRMEGNDAQADVPKASATDSDTVQPEGTTGITQGGKKPVKQPLETSAAKIEGEIDHFEEYFAELDHQISKAIARDGTCENEAAKDAREHKMREEELEELLAYDAENELAGLAAAKEALLQEKEDTLVSLDAQEEALHMKVAELVGAHATIMLEAKEEQRGREAEEQALHDQVAKLAAEKGKKHKSALEERQHMEKMHKELAAAAAAAGKLKEAARIFQLAQETKERALHLEVAQAVALRAKIHLEKEEKRKEQEKKEKDLHRHVAILAAKKGLAHENAVEAKVARRERAREMHLKIATMTAAKGKLHEEKLRKKLERESREKELHKQIASLAAARGKIHEEAEEARAEQERRDQEMRKNIAILAAKGGFQHTQQVKDKLALEAREKQMHLQISKLAAAKGKAREDAEEALAKKKKRQEELHKHVSLLAAKRGLEHLGAMEENFAEDLVEKKHHNIAVVAAQRGEQYMREEEEKLAQKDIYLEVVSSSPAKAAAKVVATIDTPLVSVQKPSNAIQYSMKTFMENIDRAAQKRDTVLETPPAKYQTEIPTFSFVLDGLRSASIDEGNHNIAMKSGLPTIADYQILLAKNKALEERVATLEKDNASLIQVVLAKEKHSAERRPRHEQQHSTNQPFSGQIGGNTTSPITRAEARRFRASSTSPRSKQRGTPSSPQSPRLQHQQPPPRPGASSSSPERDETQPSLHEAASEMDLKEEIKREQEKLSLGKMNNFLEGKRAMEGLTGIVQRLKTLRAWRAAILNGNNVDPEALPPPPPPPAPPSTEQVGSQIRGNRTNTVTEASMVSLSKNNYHDNTTVEMPEAVLSSPLRNKSSLEREVSTLRTLIAEKEGHPPPPPPPAEGGSDVSKSRLAFAGAVSNSVALKKRGNRRGTFMMAATSAGLL
jgi:hypothetical protein